MIGMTSGSRTGRENRGVEFGQFDLPETSPPLEPLYPKGGELASSAPARRHSVFARVVYPADWLLGRVALAWKTVVVALIVLVPLGFVLPPYLAQQNATI